MFERFTERARQAVVLAQDEARHLRHDHLGPEHLLLGILREEEGVASDVLGAFGVTLEATRVEVARLVGEGDAVTYGQIPFTPPAKKVLERALREALSLGHNYIGTEHILLGLCGATDGVAVTILAESGVSAAAARESVTSLLGRPGFLPPAAGRLISPGPRAPRLVRWEYRIEQWRSAAPEGRTVELNELGSEGWQLAALLPDGEGAQWIFQRPLEPRRRPGPDAPPRETRRRSAEARGNPPARSGPISVASGIALGELAAALGVPITQILRLPLEIALSGPLSDDQIEAVARQLGRGVRIEPAEPRAD